MTVPTMIDAYTAIADAPLDLYNVPDQGDQGHPPAEIPRELLSAAKVPPTPIVPFHRTLELGSVGRDVIGAKRAIWKRNGLKIPVRATQTFGPTAVAQLKNAQKEFGLPADGQLGPVTLKKLGPFFDQLAFLDYAGYRPGSSQEEQARAAQVAYALWAYNNRVQLGYSEYRPMTDMAQDLLELLPNEFDCSTLAAKDFKYARLPDPNGETPPYNGAGNTTSLRAHGRPISLAAAKPGDLVHYNDPAHVAIYVGNGRVISHGSQIGPLLLMAAYRPIAEVRTYL